MTSPQIQNTKNNQGVYIKTLHKTVPMTPEQAYNATVDRELRRVKRLRQSMSPDQIKSMEMRALKTRDKVALKQAKQTSTFAVNVFEDTTRAEQTIYKHTSEPLADIMEEEEPVTKIKKTASERVKHYQQSVSATAASQQSALNAVNTNFAHEKALRRQQKTHRITYYHLRQKWHGPKNLTNPKHRTDLETDEQRLMAYNKHHKCKCHNLRYNTIRFNKETNSFEFGCDRGDRTEWDVILDKHIECPNCHNKKMSKFSRDSCLCTIYRCGHCLYEQYAFEGITAIHCVCGCKDDTTYFKRYLMFCNKSKSRSWKSNEEDLKRREFFRELRCKYYNIPFIPSRKLYASPTPNYDRDFPALKPHGGAITRVARTAMDAVKSMFDDSVKKLREYHETIKKYIKQTITKVGDKIKSKIANIISDQTVLTIYTWFEKILGPLISGFEHIGNWMVDNSLLMPAVAETIRNFMNAPLGLNFNKIAMMGIAGSLFAHWKGLEDLDDAQDFFSELAPTFMSLFAGEKGITTSPFAVKHDFPEFTPSISSADRPLNFDASSPKEDEFSDAISDDELAFVPHSGYFSFVEKFYKAVKKSLKLNLSFRIFFDTLRNFNTVVQSCKNAGAVLSCFVDHLPDFLKAIVRSSDTREYIKAELRKPESPFRKLADAALAISIAKSHQIDDVKLADYKAVFKVRHVELLAHVKDKEIAYDHHIMEFIRRAQLTTRVPGSTGRTIAEPFFIRLSGEAGIGKSNLAYPLLSSVSAIYEEFENQDALMKKTYTRNPTKEAWDGCTPDKIYAIYDDYGQDREEIDFKEVIMLKSRTLFMPPFSSIEGEDEDLVGIKGNVVNFRAVVLSSNVTELRSTTLNSNPAINRRKDIMFDCRWAPGFTDPRPDYSHMIVTRLSCTKDAKTDYKPMWTAKGMDAIKRMKADTYKEAKHHKQMNVDMDKVTADLLFTAADVPESGEHTLNVWNDENRPFKAHGLDSLDGYEYIQYASEAIFSMMAGISYGASVYAITSFIGDYFNKTKMGGYQRIVYGATVLAGAFIAWQWISDAFPSATPHSGENRDAKAKTSIRAHASPLNKSLEEIYAPNAFTIEVEHSGIPMQSTNGFFIKGNVGLMNKHLFFNKCEGETFIPNGSRIKLFTTKAEKPFEFEFDYTRLRQVGEDDRDVVLYWFPPKVPAASTLLAHFWDGGVSLEGRNISTIQANFGKYEVHHGSVIRDQIESRIDYTINGREQRITQHNSFVVNTPSQPGKCGSILYANDPLLQQKILGINVGSSTPYRSHSLIVTRKQLDEALATFDQSEEIIFERLLPHQVHSGWRTATPEDLEKSGLEGNVSIHAVSERKLVPCTKTKLRKSPLYNLIQEATTAPAQLSLPGKLKEGMLKYANPSQDFPKKKLKAAMQSIREEIDAVPVVRLRRTLTTFEAINGVSGMPYLDSLDMTTSPGFPFVYTGINGAKRQLFLEVDGSLYPNEDLDEHIKLVEQRLAAGILPDYPYIDTLKDERKDLIDVEEGKVRMFAMNNVALSIVMRKLLLPRVAAAYQARHSTFLAIGTNKASMEWDSMVRRMLEVGNKFYDADYKKFDTRASLAARLMANTFFLEDWQDEEVRKMIETVLRYDAQSLHQFYNFLVLLSSGTSSGSILTALINSLINELYIRCCWQEIFAKTPLEDLANYRMFVRTKNYGDDLLITVDAEIEDSFNDEKIAKVLSRYDITMTPGDKRGQWGPKEVTEMSFLKHKTRRWCNIYVPLASDYKEQINWIRTGLKSQPAEVACQDNCNSALRAAFYYGPETFNILRSQILLHRPSYNLITFSPLFSQWRSYGTICDTEGAFSFGRSKMTPGNILTFFEDKGIQELPFELEEDAVDINMNFNKQTFNNNTDELAFKPHSGSRILTSNRFNVLAEVPTHDAVEETPLHKFTYKWFSVILKAFSDLEDAGQEDMDKEIQYCRFRPLEIAIIRCEVVRGHLWFALEMTDFNNQFLQDQAIQNSLREYAQKTLTPKEKTIYFTYVYTERKENKWPGDESEDTDSDSDEDCEAFKPHGILDGVIEAGANEIKGIVNSIVPDNIVADVFGILDKPQIGLHPEPLIHKEQNYMSNTRNMDYVDVLTADPKAIQLCDSDMFGTEVDEMCYDELLKKKFCLLATIPWSTTQAIGTQLFFDPVGPMSQYPVSFVPTAPTGGTLHDAICSRHPFWAGGWVYVVRVVGTQFHEGKLNMNYHPALAPSSVAALTTEDSVSQYTEAHFVRNGKNIMTVLCPFLGDTPVKKVWNGTVLSDVYTTGTESRFVDYFSGTFEIRVATQLNAPAAVASTIGIQIFKACAQDFKLFMNTMSGVSFQWFYPELEAFKPHSGNGSTPGLGEPVAVMNASMGVILSEQEAPMSVSRVEGRAKVTHARASAYNNDEAWTIEKMLARHNLVSTITWNASSVVGVNLIQYDVMADLLNLTIAATPFARFERFVCDTIELTFTIVSNRFAFGDLWAYWRPTMLPKALLGTPLFNNLSEISTLQHVSLDPNTGTTAVLRIPFTYNKQFVDLVNGDCLGQITLIPAYAFTPGTDGPSDAQVQIYMSVEGAKFLQPRTGATAFRQVEPVMRPTMRPAFEPRDPDWEEPWFKPHMSGGDVPDRNTPMHTYKPTVLAAGSGEWNDIGNSQFGEQFTGLRELCKKYQRYYRASYPMPTTLTDPQLAGVDPIIINFPAASFNPALNPQIFCGNHIGFSSALFRLFRGSLCYKTRVRAYASALAVTTTMPLPNITARAYFTPLQSGFGRFPNTGSTLAFPSAGSQDTVCVPPISMAYASENQTAEYKIPFMSNRTAGIVPQYYDNYASAPEYVVDNIYNPNIVVALYLEGIPQTPAVAALFSYTVTFEHDISFGDEACFGVYTGYPPSFIQTDYSVTDTTIATAPDAWMMTSTRRKGKATPK